VPLRAVIAELGRGPLVAVAIAITFVAGVLAASAYSAVRRLRPRSAVIREARAARDALTLLGDALAATHNARALLAVILDATVEATSALGGVATLAGETVASRGSAPGLKALVLILDEEPGEEMEVRLEPPAGGFSSETEALASSIANQGRVALENARLHRAVEQQALTDDLTGLANRRRFMQALGEEVRRSERFDTRFGIVLFDLDNFKQINDRFGHEAGDLVLKSVTAVIQSCLRDVDLAVRLGGEEFAVLVPEADLEGARLVAERIRGGLHETPTEVARDQFVVVTASFGLAAYPENETPLDLLRAADSALYRAKAEGKDRTLA
jgi:diguanylate cyclase (GGDEF)-like protein